VSCLSEVSQTRFGDSLLGDGILEVVKISKVSMLCSCFGPAWLLSCVMTVLVAAVSQVDSL
jgi:hypothetical protein